MQRLAQSLAFLGPLCLAALVTAQAPSVPTTLAGSWRCTVSPDRARDIALAAFQPRIDALPSFVQGMVRDRIRERMRPPTRLEIALEGDRVRVTNIGARRVVVDTPLGGTTRVVGDDGESRRVTQRLRSGWLEQVFQGENGNVSRLLSTEPDGQTLHADLTVENERLGAPVRWRLDYTR